MLDILKVSPSGLHWEFCVDEIRRRYLADDAADAAAARASGGGCGVEAAATAEDNGRNLFK